MRDDLRGDTATGEDAASLVEAALQLRWRAPELALLLADRAAATAGTTADLLAAASLNRLGREVEAGQRALAGLRGVGSDASEPELARQLRVELAAGAIAVGAVGAALVVLHPVLQAEPATGPAVRATALTQLATALTVLERDDGAALALDEADELYRDGADLDTIPAVLLRGAVRALRASQHRRHGELAAAEAAARDGLELLSELSSPADDGCAIGARLVLELVLTLLDRGELRAAGRAAAAVVTSSVRAAAAPSRGWLHLALATRVHQPGGRHREALALLGDAIDAARRHLLDPVLAGCLDGQCRIHEERGEHAEALQCLRSAHAAEYRHRRASDALRSELIEEFGGPRRDVSGLADQLTDLVGTPGARPRHGKPRHRGDGREQFPVAELLLAAGRSGRGPERRRAANPPEAAPDDAGAPRHDPAEADVGMPLDTAAGTAESAAAPDRAGQTPPPTLVSKQPMDEIGLGDLLAEALAAFEQGRRFRGTAAGAAGGPPTEPVNQAAGSGPATDPEPAQPAELGGEQVWQPPGNRRHSAAGD